MGIGGDDTEVARANTSDLRDDAGTCSSSGSFSTSLLLQIPAE